MPKNIKVYNPAIEALINECEDDWGEPVANREGLVEYGIPAIDRALYGIDTINGELILIQGEEKRGKTRLVANFLINMFTAERPNPKPFVVIDTLESGMRPKKYRDTLISMVATKALIEMGHRSNEICPICEGKCRQLKISPKWLRYNTRTEDQAQAIGYAMETIARWPLEIYGPGIREGNTRDLYKANERWHELVAKQGMKILVMDHVQQYAFDRDITDYEKQLRAISVAGDFVAQESTVAFVISQVSLTSVREARQGQGQVVAQGGKKGAQEANTVFSASIDEDTAEMLIRIEEARDFGKLSVWQPIELISGAFYGTAHLGDK